MDGKGEEVREDREGRCRLKSCKPGIYSGIPQVGTLLGQEQRPCLGVFASLGSNEHEDGIWG